MAIDYTNTAAPLVTDARGVQRTWTHTTINGLKKLSSITGSACNTCGPYQAIGYDSNGYMNSSTDWDSNVTHYVNDSLGRETSRTEAYGTSLARTITTSWYGNYRLPQEIDEGTLRKTVYAYYSGTANLNTKTVTDLTTLATRTWTYSNYTSWGMPQTIDGPRTDVADTTGITYYTCTTGYQCGQIHTVTDALGHVTTFNTYDGNSRPTQVTDPNSVVTNLTYWPRGWIKSVQVGSETTNLTYWPTGLLKTLSLPDGESLTYTYNAAHQLTTVTDQLGDTINYTPDAMGNVTAVQVKDPSGTLTRSHTWQYNTLNQLLKSINANGADTSNYTFDGNNQLKTVQDPNSNTYTYYYDALNRISQLVTPSSSSGSSSNATTYLYTAVDQLASVQDPRSLTTGYTTDALNNLKQIVSPDTGTTNNTAFDAAGNLTSSTDANGKTTTYQYDALNRLTKATRADATVVNFYYDQNANGIGHLTGMSDPSGSTSWKYDANGHIIQRTEVVGTITLNTYWSYSATTGQLQSLTLPSGKVISYTWTNGQITALKLNGTALVSSIAYAPFDGPKSWSFANGQTVTIGRDPDGRITSDAIESLVSYDPGSRISGTTLGNLSLVTGNNGYGYDHLDEINSLTGTSGGGPASWTYDVGGNRATQVTGGVTTTYTIAGTSSRISQVKLGASPAVTYSYDNAGSETADGTNSYTYDATERLHTATHGTLTGTYAYNGLGERVLRTVNGSVEYAYDNQGQLIGEYNGSGNLTEETIYLGRIPVAVVTSAGTFYILTDHLGAPRQINNASQQAVWTWTPGPFGLLAPNSNPNSLGTFVYNLRFPGQYYDAETGNFYNYQRDYNPTIGRYLESDPIGLNGGFNTYAYVGGNPLRWKDPRGLSPQDVSNAWNWLQNNYSQLTSNVWLGYPAIEPLWWSPSIGFYQPTGIYMPFTGLFSYDAKFLKCNLTDKEKWELMDTLAHEALHIYLDNQIGTLNYLSNADSEHAWIDSTSYDIATYWQQGWYNGPGFSPISSPPPINNYPR